MDTSFYFCCLKLCVEDPRPPQWTFCQCCKIMGEILFCFSREIHSTGSSPGTPSFCGDTLIYSLPVFTPRERHPISHLQTAGGSSSCSVPREVFLSGSDAPNCWNMNRPEINQPHRPRWIAGTCGACGPRRDAP